MQIVKGSLFYNFLTACSPFNERKLENAMDYQRYKEQGDIWRIAHRNLKPLTTCDIPLMVINATLMTLFLGGLLLVLAGGMMFFVADTIAYIAALFMFGYVDPGLCAATTAILLFTVIVKFGFDAFCAGSFVAVEKIKNSDIAEVYVSWRDKHCSTVDVVSKGE